MRRKTDLRRTWSVDGAAIWTLAILGSVLAWVFAWRRLQGAISQPLPGDTLLAVGAVLGMAGILLRAAAWRMAPADTDRQKPRFWCLWLAPAVWALGMGVALTAPGIGLAGGAAIWIAVAVQEMAAAGVLHRGVPCTFRENMAGAEHANRSSAPATDRDIAVVKGSVASRSVAAGIVDDEVAVSPAVQRADETGGTEDTEALEDTEDGEETDDAEWLEFPRGVTQQLTRFATEQGQDVVTSALRAAFAGAQRQETLHVAFCPPFATMPEISVRQVSGPPATLQVAQVLHHGVRIEVRRSGECREPADVLVELTAMGAPPAGCWWQGNRTAGDI